jgi:hypothetical protein
MSNKLWQIKRLVERNAKATSTSFHIQIPDEIKSNSFPNRYSGFYLSCELRKEISWISADDPNDGVSLALLNNKASCLKGFADKLPLMVINVHRFRYTWDAFRFKKYPDPVMEALNFFLQYEITKVTKDKSIENNEKFSNLLHQLQSTGNEDYVMELARTLLFEEVHIVKAGKLVYKYRAEESFGSVTLQGYLTAVYNQNCWYVSPTNNPIIG